jgi:hypothetical protein
MHVLAHVRALRTRAPRARGAWLAVALHNGVVHVLVSLSGCCLAGGEAADVAWQYA